MIVDPFGLITFDLPPGWCEYPGSSRLSRLIFIPWSDDASLSVELFPSAASPDDDAARWRAAAADGLAAPAGVDTTELSSRGRPALVLRDPVDGGGELNVLAVRCATFDVVVRGRSSGGAGPLRLAFDEVIETLDAVREPPEVSGPGPDEWSAKLTVATTARNDGDFRSACEAAEEVWTWIARHHHRLVRENGSEVARATCALALIDAVTVIAGCTADPLLARGAEQLARRTGTSLRDASAPDEVRSAADARVSQTCSLQAALNGMPFRSRSGHVPPSAALAGMRVRAALTGRGPEGLGSRDGLEAVLADACLGVVDARLTDPGGDDLAVILASTVATLLAMASLLDGRMERALAAGELSIALARGAGRTGAGRSEAARAALVHGLLDLTGTLLEIGDAPALDRAGRILDQAESTLDQSAGNGAVRVWAALLRAGLLVRRGRYEEAAQVASEGLRVAATDDTTDPAHIVLLRQLLGDAVEPESVGPGPRGRLSFGNQMVRRGRQLLDDGDREESLRLVVTGLHEVLSTAPFGPEAADAFAAAADCLRPAAGDEVALLLIADLAAVAAMDAREVFLRSDALRVSSGDARSVGDRREILLADLLGHRLVEFAAEDADAGRARALLRLVSGAAPAAAVPATVTPPEPPGADHREYLKRAADWLLEGANRILGAADVPPPLTAADMRHLAADLEAVILLPQPVGDRLALFVVRPGDGPHVRWSAAPAAQVLESARTLSGELRIAAGTTSGATLADVSDALLGPVADLIGTDEHLVVIPYRELWMVPFGMLSTTGGSRLGEDHAISLAPSMATLRELRDRGSWQRPGPMRSLVLGDPRTAARYGLDRLPGAGAEATELAGRLRTAGLSATELTVAIGDAATVHAYRTGAAGSDLVHLACHARLSVSPATSGLFLAADATSDGLLTVADVPSVRLDDAVVVLSACETGQGRLAADGLIGLGRAYLQAGARAVVMSLWRVSDFVTSALMRHLYDALLAPTAAADLARALQHATEATRKDLLAGAIRSETGEILDARPAHWGPFVILGDAHAVRFGR